MSFKKASKDSYEWKPIKHTIDKVKYAVLLLNHSLDHLNGAHSPSFDHIWQKAERRLAVDGGSKYLKSSHRIPDILSGDFDSVTNDIIERFRSKGTQIIETPDQNRTDFTKAVQIVLDSNQSLKNQMNGNSLMDKPQRIESIVTIWSSSGRIDQVLANINTLYMDGKQLEDREDGSYLPIFLVQINGSVSWLLNKGCHVIESDPLSKWCSLIPIGSACCVTTTGFRWNLNKQMLSFGGLISSSNEFDKSERLCRIETDKPLLFSMDISKSNQF